MQPTSPVSATRSNVFHYSTAGWDGELLDIAQQIDTDNSGSLDSHELAIALKQYSALKGGVEKGDIVYTTLPPEIANVLKEFDYENNGKLSIVELVRAAELSRQMTKTNKNYRKIVLALASLIAVLLLGFFFLTYLAIDISKEVRSNNDGTLVSASGAAARTDSASFDVTPDGRMVMRSSSSNCTGDNCRRLDDESERLLMTQSAPATSQVLTSVVPDEFLSEMKKLRLLLGNETSPLTVELDVINWVRKLDSGSQCGSIVEVRVRWGLVILDDTDIYVDLDFSRNAKAELGVDVDETGPLSASGHYRRLAAGSTLVGLFNFILDYEWKCESTAKPLEKLTPPYSFTIRTLIWCGSKCDSAYLPNHTLPGWAMDAAVSEFEYVEIVESVVASETEMVSKQLWPNLPGVEMYTHTNLTNGKATTVKTFGNTTLSCHDNVDNQSLQFKDPNKWVVAAMGRIQHSGEWFRKFQVYLRDETIKEDVRKRATVELWEKSETQTPYKFFMPNQLEGSSISVFESFSNNVSMDELETLKEDIFEDCAKESVTNTSRLWPLQDASPLDEKEKVLKLYEALFAEGLTDVPNDPYWHAVVAKGQQGRRLGSDRRRRAQIKELNELDSITELSQCPLIYETGVFKMKFCNEKAEVPLDPTNPSATTPTETYFISAEAEATANFGPITVTIGGSGAVKLRRDLTKDHMYGKGEIEMKVELGVGIGSLINAAVGCKGWLHVEAPSQSSDVPEGTFKIEGGLGPYGTIDIFGMIQITVPHYYPQFVFTMDKLGPFPLDNANNKADDTIKIEAKWTIEVSFFFFKFSVSVPITVMPETTLWSATPDMYGTQEWFTKDCELVERTYDRCSHDYIRIPGTYDEKTGVVEPAVLKGSKAYPLVSYSAKRDFNWWCSDSNRNEWVRFPRHVNKLVAQLENNDRRIVWVGLLCDRYLTEGERWHYSGGTDDDCREAVSVSTNYGMHWVHKWWSVDVPMGRVSDNEFWWVCEGHSRRRGYGYGWNRAGCGRHNVIKVRWQDRRRDGAVRWECWDRLGSDRPTSADCYVGANEAFWSSYKVVSEVETPQECSQLCGSDMTCWGWTYDAWLKTCSFAARGTSKGWSWGTHAGLPSYNCDATFYDWSITYGGERKYLELPLNMRGQSVTVSTQGLASVDTYLEEPCVNDDAHGNLQSECTGSGTRVVIRLYSSYQTGSGRVSIKLASR
eukprot:gb/GFBE01011897.1/.p1 GENE.gb/GFBE01011897.1/~~gb/GFBE01011897.1/.p1  ORF type:complete len:1204 (+),score=265.25 gb/GFBE01011897.1/:1-3612(+)